MWGYFEIIWNIIGVVFFLGGLYSVWWCIQDAYKEYGLPKKVKPDPVKVKLTEKEGCRFNIRLPIK